MIAIKSTVNVVHYTRTQKTGKIIIEATAINPEGDNYRIDLTDYAEYPDTYLGENQQPVTYLKKELLSNRVIYKSNVEVSALFQAVQTGISPTDDYAEKERLIKQSALLMYVQNDFINEAGETIYGLLPNQWVLCNEE